MEKRLIIPIVLSFLVLFAWSILFPPPRRSLKETTQVVDNKQVTDSMATSPSSRPPSFPVEQNTVVPKPIDNEQISTLESDKLIVEFSNIGGTIKNIRLKEYRASFPLTSINYLLSFDSNIYNASELRENFIKYEWESSDIRIERIYEIVQGEFIIRTKTKIINKSEMSKLINGSTIGYELDMSNQNNPKTRDTDKPLNEYVVFAKNSIIRKNNAYKFSEKENREANEAIEWVAFRNKYFCTIIKPRYETLGYKIKALDESHLRVSIHFPDQNIEGAGTAVFDSLIYTGPEEIRLLRKYKEGFEKIQMFYRFGLFDGIAKIIYSAMHAFYKFIPNWGIVIILISSLIYLVTYPLTIRGMLSMKKIQGIQPKIASLKEKYKNNPQKMNQEMMEIYKREKINPFGGCLPFLFQMPIFIGLYQVLWRSVSFKNAKFLWIKDLSEPDRLFVFPHSLPIIGNEFNLLPLLMAFIMFYQQKISSKNMVMTDAAQVSQQKMMMIMMPIMMGFIFYKFASGLTLYFTMFYIFSTITQYRMYKNQPVIA